MMNVDNRLNTDKKTERKKEIIEKCFYRLQERKKSTKMALQ